MESRIKRIALLWRWLIIPRACIIGGYDEKPKNSSSSSDIKKSSGAPKEKKGSNMPSIKSSGLAANASN
jgi:hypothetical protein